MKKLLPKFLLILFIFSNPIFSQNSLKKIDRKEFIGEKIKFLINDKDQNDYRYFGKTKKVKNPLNYNEFKGRSGIIINKKRNIYSIKMTDNNEIIYLELKDYYDLPNNIGLYSLLEKAKEKYLGKTVFKRVDDIMKILLKKEFEKCKIIRINFAEENLKYSQLYGPFNIYYTSDKDTTLFNGHFTESYAPKKGYEYKHQKEKVFENVFSFKEKNYGIWYVKNFVDEFNDYKNENYLVNIDSSLGTFSNSATQDSKLNMKIIIVSSSKIYFQLFEYDGNNPVKAISPENYTILVKDKFYEKFKLRATNYSDRLKLDKKSSSILHNILLKGGEIKFNIINNTYRSSTYNYIIKDASGYENAFKKLNNK